MRLQRIGRKNDPSYRVVVTDSRNAAKRGRNVDLLGSYYPKLGKFEIDGERAKDWVSKGVQPSDTVYNFLVSKGIVEGKKKNVLPRKSPVVNEEKMKAEAEAKAKAEAEAAEKAQAEVTETAEAPVAEVTAIEPVETPAEPETTETTDAPVEEVK